jgi:periplasmic protein CpxP/Spy
MNILKRKTILILMLAIVALSILLLSSPAFSQGKGSLRPGERIKRSHDQLNLSAEQKERIRVIRNKYSDLLDDVIIEIRQARLQMMGEMRKDNPDRARIEAKLKKVMELQEKRHKIILDEFFEIRELLTPEQRKLFARRMTRGMMRDNNPGKSQKIQTN